jgi:hypothetical protein
MKTIVSLVTRAASIIEARQSIEQATGLKVRIWDDDFGPGGLCSMTTAHDSGWDIRLNPSFILSPQHRKHATIHELLHVADSIDGNDTFNCKIGLNDPSERRIEIMTAKTVRRMISAQKPDPGLASLLDTLDRHSTTSVA